LTVDIAIAVDNAAVLAKGDGSATHFPRHGCRSESFFKNRHFGSNFVVHFPILAEESSAHDVSLNSALKSMTSNFRLTSPVMSSTPFHQTPIRLPARRSTASNPRVNPIPANFSS
jgi:hypothetical protein